MDISLVPGAGACADAAHSRVAAGATGSCRDVPSLISAARARLFLDQRGARLQGARRSEVVDGVCGDVGIADALQAIRLGEPPRLDEAMDEADVGERRRGRRLQRENAEHFENSDPAEGGRRNRADFALARGQAQRIALDRAIVRDVVGAEAARIRPLPHCIGDRRRALDIEDISAAGGDPAHHRGELRIAHDRARRGGLAGGVRQPGRQVHAGLR